MRGQKPTFTHRVDQVLGCIQVEGKIYKDATTAVIMTEDGSFWFRASKGEKTSRIVIFLEVYYYIVSHSLATIFYSHHCVIFGIESLMFSTQYMLCKSTQDSTHSSTLSIKCVTVTIRHLVIQFLATVKE